ncbi:SprT family zinc-dependent metalloprotease [Enterobacteriaceae bacterium LUAb1]
MKLPRIPVVLQQSAMCQLRAKLQQASDKLDKHFPEPVLRYQQRGTVAGTAWLQQWEIRLNPVLLMENQQAFIDEVIPHELAHLLVWKLFGKVPPHGKAWQWMMETVLDVPARCTHNFSLASVQPRGENWYCRCQQHQLTIRRHNKAVRGKSQYRCRHCGDILQPSGPH